MIFGKRRCNYHKDWSVRLNFVSGEKQTISEQMHKDEAEEVYNKLKSAFEDEKNYIESNYEQDKTTSATELFVKSNIVSIEMLRD